MAGELSLDEAIKVIRKFKSPGKYTWKNSMSKVAALIRNGKTTNRKRGKTYTIPLSLKDAFKRHMTMGGVKLAPLSDAFDTRRRGDRRSAYASRFGIAIEDRKARDEPLYSLSDEVTGLFKTYTKKNYNDGHGGYHVEFFRGGDEPELVFGVSSRVYARIHHGGEIFGDSKKGRSRKPSIVPPRPVLQVTPELADAAAEIFADEYADLIAKGFS